jgi:hypothetical protein
MQVMVDRLQSLRRDRVRRTIGALSATQVASAGSALRLWLALDV